MTRQKLLCIIWIVTLCSARPATKDDDAELEPYTLDEYLTGALSYSGWNGTWITDYSFLFRNYSGGNIVEYNVREGTIELFLEASILSNYSGASYTVSPDLQYVLIRYNQQTVFRHSTTAQFAIYDRDSGTVNHVAEAQQLQTATWAPAGTGLVYVRSNNIYYIPSPDEVLNPVAITSDGVEGVFYNGIPDWVYEEEVLSSGSALWISPEGNRLAYAVFNDTEVDNFTYFEYGDPGTLDSQYPEVITLKYPKVGRTNPTVALKVAFLDNTSAEPITLNVIPEEYLDDNNNILFDVTWATNDEVSALITNRVQNQAKMRRCNVQSNECSDESEYEESNGWLDLAAPIYSADGQSYVLLLSQPEDNDTYKHIVHVSPYRNITRLTYGKRVVTTLYGWDETNNLIYYAGSVEGYPSQQQVYVINTQTLEDTCLTCDFVDPEGDKCLYAGASFSTELSYFTKACQGRNPYYMTIQNTRNESDYFLWLDNANYRSKLSTKLLPVIEDVDVPLSSGFTAKVRLYLPPNYDSSGATKYPAIVYVYAGPNSVRITDAHSLGFLGVMVTDRNYIYISIDGRGSGRKGDNMMFAIYRKLATVEIEDQIAVTKYLQQNYPFIDANNTGIWGWSYGGFAAAWVLAQDTEKIFNFAVSVAPVTNFIYYDSIYTERYMGLPTEEDNLEGYNNTDLSSKAEAFRDRKFLLIHGNADDNVHYQQAMLFSKALEHADVLFQQVSYPDEAHGLSNVSPHLYHTLDRFFARSFGLSDPPKTDMPKSVTNELE